MQLHRNSKQEVWASSCTMLVQAEKFELGNTELGITGTIHKKANNIFVSNNMASLNTVRAHFIFSWKLLWLYRTALDYACLFLI